MLLIIIMHCKTQCPVCNQYYSKSSNICMGHVVWVTKKTDNDNWASYYKNVQWFAEKSTALATTKSLATVHQIHPMSAVEQCQLVAKVTTNTISAHACRAAALDIGKWCQLDQHQWGKGRIARVLVVYTGYSI